MVAYNFQAKFAERIESGDKRQTIRPRRKYPTRVGAPLHLYTGMRTRSCRLLKEAVCIAVTPVVIEERNHHLVVILGGRRLNGQQLDAFVLDDGFQRRMDMRDFFASAYGFPFKGEVIKW